MREQVFTRQKQLGVIPPDAELTPRDEAFPAWEDLPDNLKAFYARQMEIYAGYVENADHNVGRVIDAIDELGELDNTLIIWIFGDNGSSMEGTLTGSFNELTMQNGIPLSDEMQLQLAERYGGMEAWGSPIVAPHYSAAWGWAGNTPFQWGKQVGSHLGGTRNPMVVHWPERITDKNQVRSQFTHVTDIAPTLLDVAGIPAPTHVDGIKQQPMHGFTLADSFTDADAVERHTQQYFETIGNRAMYKDGWWLAVKTRRIPWVLTPDALAPYRPGVWNPDDDPVELYYLPDDFSQARNLAAENPKKVKELTDLFWAEAEKYQVLPLLATLGTFFGYTPSTAGRHQARIPPRRAERHAGHDPAHLQPLVHHQRGPDRAAAGRAGRDRGRGRPPGRVLALRGRRPAHAHVLDDGRVHLPATGHRTVCPWARSTYACNSTLTRRSRPRAGR